MDNIKVFQGAKKIIFEAAAPLASGFIPAVDKCNTVWLNTGRFNAYCFNPAQVRDAKPDEVAAYKILKRFSKHAPVETPTPPH